MAAARKEHMEAAEALAVLMDLMENSQSQEVNCDLDITPPEVTNNEIENTALHVLTTNTEAAPVQVDTSETTHESEFLPVGIMMQIPDHSLELSQHGNEAESDMEAEDEQDVAYNPDTSPEPSTDSDTEMDPSHKPESIALRSPTKIRKRKPHQWKSNIRKKLRLEGDEHTNSELGPMCASAFCKKSNLRNCSSLEETDRKEIFTSFWGMRKKLYSSFGDCTAYQTEEKHNFIQKAYFFVLCIKEI